MATSKQRQRELARAKWERQQVRRTEQAHRRRVISIVVGTIVGLIVVALIGWVVLHIVDEENTRDDQTPSTPTGSFSTNLLTPSSAAPTNTGQDNGNTRKPEDTKATKSGGNG